MRNETMFKTLPKKIVYLFLEPLKALSNRNIAERTSNFFAKNHWLAYALSIVVTLIMVFLHYILPHIAW